MGFTYLIHDMAVQLPFACAELGTPVEARPEVYVAAGEVPRALDEPLACDDRYELTRDQYLYRGGERSARFLVEQGGRITFQRSLQCEDAQFMHHLLYPVMAATLRQRGLLVLHASSAIAPEGAVLVSGVSGTGKSSTVAGLTARDYALQSDDVSALRVGPGGGLEVLPGTRHVHVNQDTADRLGVDTSGLAPQAWHRMKMAVPRAVDAVRQAVPVWKIVYLSHSQSDLIVEVVRGRDKVPLLLQSIYGPLLPEQHYSSNGLLCQAMREIPILSIARPPGRWTLDSVLDAISRGSS